MYNSPFSKEVQAFSDSIPIELKLLMLIVVIAFIFVVSQTASKIDQNLERITFFPRTSEELKKLEAKFKENNISYRLEKNGWRVLMLDTYQVIVKKNDSEKTLLYINEITRNK